MKIGDGLDTALTLAKRVETKVRLLTHGRIRNLVVEEVQGQVIVERASPVPSRQAACHARSARASFRRNFAEKITVG